MLEFFADKIPWVDSTWDVVHTLISPVGGILLGLAAFGQITPEMAVLGAILGGGVAATSHTAKASTRLLINASPEPLTNTGASVAEDTVVLGGIGLIAFSPLIALIAVVIFVGVAIYFLPKTLRILRRGWVKVKSFLDRGQAPEPATIEAPH